jgi:hypothetical protein
MSCDLSNTPVAPRADWGARGRRWLFRLAVLAGILALAEGSSYLTYWVLIGHPFTFHRFHHDQRGVIPSRRTGHPTEIFHADLHPYVGFSYDPDWQGHIQADNPVTDWGFTDARGLSPVRRRGPGKAVVAILGASVASIFSANGTEALARELQQAPAFAGKEVEFVNLAVGGFKQPQQVMALNYALALGADYDAVINLDGLNEIAWYQSENAASGIFHLYPTGWHWVVGKMPDAAGRRQVGKIAYLTGQRGKWAQLFRTKPLRWSVTAGLIWKLRDRYLEREANTTEMALRSQRQLNLPYRAHGPHNPAYNEAGMQAQLVANWERCSLMLDKLCKAHGMRYYHFLQPNQYVPGSKPLSAEEQRVAYWSGQPARLPVEQGYPLLREAGRRLAAQGVCFHDLSMVFARHEETFYFDNCCHLNRAGNEVLAAAMARAITETPEPPPAEDRHIRRAEAPEQAGPKQAAVPPAGRWDWADRWAVDSGLVNGKGNRGRGQKAEGATGERATGRWAKANLSNF